jgi:ABC-type multidrug transport system ATPase subunit
VTTTSFQVETVAPRERPREVQPDVVAEGLTKIYPDGTRGAAEISLTARAGEVVGIVGPNGAGKSTTLKMLATLLRPTAGQATICGHPLNEQKRVRPLIGVALQDVGLDPLMTGSEHFEVQAALYRVPVELARRRADQLLQRFAFAPYADRPVGVCSGGIQRRLSLALALLGDPHVVIFDEPTVGLDPRSRHEVWRLIQELRDEGRVVLLSTQYLEEADLLCGRIYVIDHGTIVVSGRPSELKARIGGFALRVQVADAPEDALAELRSELRSDDGVREDDTLVFPLDGRLELVERVVGAIRRRDLHLRRLEIQQPSLDDVFLHFTGRLIEPEPLGHAGLDLGARTHRGGGKRWK